MAYYIQNVRTKVYYGVTNDLETAKKWLSEARKSYPDEDWELIE